MNEHFTRDEITDLAYKHLGVFLADERWSDVKAMLEDAVAAIDKKREAQGAVATVTSNSLSDYSEISRTYQAPIPIGTKLYTHALPAQPAEPVKLEDIEQYRLQMAGISTAALGYWTEGDSIHPDYDTLALRDVAKLYAKYDMYFKLKHTRPEDADAAAKKLAECMDCPWEHIPEWNDENVIAYCIARGISAAKAFTTGATQPQATEPAPKRCGLCGDCDAKAQKACTVPASTSWRALLSQASRRSSRTTWTAHKPSSRMMAAAKVAAA